MDIDILYFPESILTSQRGSETIRSYVGSGEKFSFHGARSVRSRYLVG